MEHFVLCVLCNNLFKNAIIDGNIINFLMSKYVTKNQQEDEKRVVSVRIRRTIFEAFKGASIAAEEYGYSMTLSSIFEIAMEDAISEFKDISGVDYQDITTSSLNDKWESKYKGSLKNLKGKPYKRDK